MGALSREYDGRVEFDIQSAASKEGQAAVLEYGLDARRHGIVMLDPKGAVASTISGHNFGKDEIQAAVEEMLQ